MSASSTNAGSAWSRTKSIRDRGWSGSIGDVGAAGLQHRQQRHQQAPPSAAGRRRPATRPAHRARPASAPAGSTRSPPPGSSSVSGPATTATASGAARTWRRTAATHPPSSVGSTVSFTLDQQPFPLAGDQDVHVADGRLGIRRHLFQHLDEPRGHRLDRVLVEQPGRVLDVAAQRPGVVRAEAEVQVDLRGRPARACWNSTSRPGSRRPWAPWFCQAQHHLEQRPVGRGPVRVEPLDQQLERDVLVVVGGQRLVPHPGQQRRRTTGRRTGPPAAPGVDEAADQVGQRLVGAAGDRGADRRRPPRRRAGAAARPARPARPWTGSSRARRPASAAPVARSGGQPGSDRVAVRTGLRRPRPVQRQVERLRHPVQFLAPVRRSAVAPRLSGSARSPSTSRCHSV